MSREAGPARQLLERRNQVISTDVSSAPSTVSGNKCKLPHSITEKLITQFKKWAKDLKRYLSKDIKVASRHMPNITNQGNANESHNEISPHNCQDGYEGQGGGERERRGVLEKRWTNWDTCALLVGMQIAAATVESIMELHQN